MSKKDGRLHQLVKRGDVIRHPRAASKTATRKASQGRFRTIRLTKGVRIEKASKAIH